MNTPILYSQSEIHSQLESLTQDTANERWTDARIDEAVNMALMDWQGRVLVPYVYTISGGWVAGSYEYTLPDYIDGPIQPQQKHYINDWYYLTGVAANSLTWTDVLEWTVEPNTSGGQTLRVDYQPVVDEARVLWWGSNGPVPTTAPVTSGSLGASDTSVTLTTKPRIGRAGYIKIDAEWMQYAGVTEAASTLTLTNLVRGVAGTTAASHSSGATVYWGVALDDGGLWVQLLDQASAFLMRFHLTNASSRETNHYEKQMVYSQQRADMFWRRYTPNKALKFRLTRRGLGPTARQYLQRVYS